MGVKMVLSGEGADELFGGYLYFHKAPDAQAFHEETIRKLSKLHMYDCLRANKSLAAWGVEGRVPFLDKEFIDVAMRLNPEDKLIQNGRIEKWVVRKAFEDERSAIFIPDQTAFRIEGDTGPDGRGEKQVVTIEGTRQYIIAGTVVEAVPVRYVMAFRQRYISKANPFGFELESYSAKEISTQELFKEKKSGR